MTALSRRTTIANNATIYRRTDEGSIKNGKNYSGFRTNQRDVA